MQSGGVEGVGVDGSQAFFGENLVGSPVGFAVLAGIGHGVHPQSGLGIDGVERAEFAARQEIALHITHGAFDPALGVPRALHPV